MGGRRDTGNYNVSVVVSMVMAKLESLKEYVRYEMEEDRLTHAELSKQLQQAYPGERGFSVRSIERLCRREGITKISQIRGGSGIPAGTVWAGPLFAFSHS